MIQLNWAATPELAHAAHQQRVSRGMRYCVASTPGFATGVLRCHNPAYFAVKWAGRAWGMFPEGSTAQITDVTDAIPGLLDELFAIGPDGWPETRVILRPDGSLTAQVVAVTRWGSPRGLVGGVAVPLAWTTVAGADVTNSIRPDGLWPFDGMQALAPHLAAAMVADADRQHLP
jgi:hypothetical protein